LCVYNHIDTTVAVCGYFQSKFWGEDDLRFKGGIGFALDSPLYNRKPRGAICSLKDCAVARRGMPSSPKVARALVVSHASSKQYYPEVPFVARQIAVA